MVVLFLSKMKKEYRVKKNQEIETILKNRKYSANSYFSIYKMTNPKTSHFRYAIILGKKIGKAVERNHLKRRITAILDQINIPIEQNIDIFIIAKPNSKNLEFKDLQKQLIYLLTKLNILKGAKND